MKQSKNISRPLDANMTSGKEAAEKEEEEGESLSEFVFDHLNDFFINHIPVDSIKDMEKTYMYYFGTVAHILAISAFLYFTWENYESQATQPFIVLSESDGSYCNAIPASITNTYLADSSGNWVGTPDFVDSQSLYSLALSNFEINTNSQYDAMMNRFQESLNTIGRVSVHQDLAENLLFWMSFIQYYSVENPSSTDFSSIGYGQLQSFQMTGTPENVFDLEYIKGTVVGASGACPVFSYSTFDQANSLLSAVYFNYTDFVKDPVCSEAVIPGSFGYVSYLDGDIYTMRMDVRTFSTAMAVNYGVIPLDNLNIVDKEPQSFVYRNVTYEIAQYYDDRTPLMQTISCFKNVTSIPHDQQQYQTVCFYVVGETFTLPVFNHYGASPLEPTYCNCNNDIGHSQKCNEFNLLSGLVFFKSPFTKVILGDKEENLKDFGLFDLMALLDKYQTYRLFNKNAYNASFLGAASNWNPTSQDISDAMSFCNNCSLMLFNSFDPTGYEVSNYKYQVFNGSCQNSTSVSSAAWQKLVDTQPVLFTQSYYECYYDKRQALVSAIGIASGNVQIFIPIFVFLLLPLLYASLVAIQQVPPKPEYTKEEQAQALEIFSMLMLRLRDGKTRGIKNRGILAGLTKEIITAAKEEGGYPDSDDEADEDEDGSTFPGHHKNRPSVRKRGSSEAGGVPITRLRNSSINSAQSDDVSTNFSEEGTGGSLQRTSTNFGSRKSTSKTPGGTPLSHRPRMGVFTKHIVERQRLAQQQQIQETQPVRQFSVASSLQRTNTSTSSFSPFARKTTVNTTSNPNRINSTIGRAKNDDTSATAAAAASSGALAYSSAALKSKNTANNDDTRPVSSGQRSAIDSTGGEGTSSTENNNNSSNNVSTDTTNTNTTTNSRRLSQPPAARRSTLFGYIFGGDSNSPKDDDAERGSEMVAKTEEVYLDLTQQMVPDNVRVLNLLAEHSQNRQTVKKALTGNDVDLLVDDLLRLFGEATQHHSDNNDKTAAASLAAESPMHTTEEGDSKPAPAAATTTTESDPIHLDVSTSRDSFSLVQAKSLSVKLAQINFEDLMARDDKTIFVKLSNALCMHASIELKYEMRQIAHKYGDRVAYNVGGKLMTVNHMDSVL